MLKSFSASGLRWLWVAIIVLGLDIFTKTLALKNLELYEPIYITSFFNLTLAYNKGAAFSFLNSASGWQSWLLGSLAVFVCFIILTKLKSIAHHQRWMGVALALIVGGALGNLYDRIAYGHVIDFLQFHLSHYYWPVFNVADSAICIGATMLFIDVVFFRKKKEK
ncbi:MAG: signal peptidase II [Gammaproteobacteria bacterium]